ncbi:Trafficking protein particle complex subunit 13 [Coemansia guatemalensis]|uniref:Trafficking protein particle complex subunit 13 n=1 Tax=Coemansia guatemalensis TaxID=2761395 RepID=A0A9W8I2Q9_9FUNG|nr:Trafficking protein particle complex subunit 13 [Coemansia guatemalensis]
MASLMRENHPLTLKVMRLSRPALTETQLLLAADTGSPVLAQALREAAQRQPTQSGQILSDSHQPAAAQQPLETFALTEALALPRSFGAMFLGETFTAQVCVCNEGALAVRDVSFKAAVQTATQQLPLAETGGVQLAGGQPLNLQVSHEIKELGSHVLACSITYLSAQGERRVLQRSFRFQAANPLVVKTKVNHLARDVLLEVQVHNATPVPMALERLRFDPAAAFVAEDLCSLADTAPLWGSRAGFVLPGDVRQYLYRLRPQLAPEGSAPAGSASEGSALGRLDILWRGPFGSVGRLQTSQLQRKPPGTPLIEVERAWVVGDRVSVETPFAARLRLRNASDQPMAVAATVHPHRHPLVIPCGPARYVLGELLPGEARELDVEFLPLAPGVQRLGAMTISDTTSGYARELDHTLDVLVEN